MSALITDAMVARGALEARAWGVVSMHGEWTNEETQQQCARDILEAVAPLIAAKAWEEGYAEGSRGRMWDSTNPYQPRALHEEAKRMRTMMMTDMIMALVEEGLKQHELTDQGCKCDSCIDHYGPEGTPGRCCRCYDAQQGEGCDDARRYAAIRDAVEAKS